MSEILTAVLVLVALAGVYALLLGRMPGRVGRPPRGFLTRQGDPSGTPLGTAALAGLAIGGALVLLNPAADTGTGALVGLVVGLLVSRPAFLPVVLPLFGWTGVVLALVGLVRFVVGTDPAGDDLRVTYRAALAGLLLAAFALGLLVHGLRAAVGRRGLALLAVVDLVTMLAHPGNRDTLALDPVGHLTYLAVAGGFAFLVGLLASEFVLGALALALATVTLAADAVAGDARSAWVGLVAAGVAVAVLLTVGRLLGGRLLRT
ncbi:hypothetical protein [Nocardioides sp. W7]|uniref:hypothetical protein n=1 Tax=Nocardioides sp. W7 TaxID=2931390 RepID=UPI001FD39A93|nr:hypothetical protein [Nocardioides sp. W7]